MNASLTENGTFAGSLTDKVLGRSQAHLRNAALTVQAKINLERTSSFEGAALLGPRKRTRAERFAHGRQNVRKLTYGTLR